MSPRRDGSDRTDPAGDGLRRILFLDDDDARAASFLRRHPEAVWVQTAAGCIEALGETWDEVHLDHDLGGETFVSIAREDCGMEVVRWLCEEPRPHLRATRFVVHSHNENAACVMVLHLQETGYRAEPRPFGAGPPAPTSPPGPLARLIRWLSGRG